MRSIEPNLMNADSKKDAFSKKGMSTKIMLVSLIIANLVICALIYLLCIIF
ncbi:MAG: hypothetical protein JWQ06_2192 [Mucilaginibacter sp.]|nr:hypothetical protein [Mucilaginibacter sp.]